VLLGTPAVPKSSFSKRMLPPFLLPHKLYVLVQQ